MLWRAVIFSVKVFILLMLCLPGTISAQKKEISEKDVPKSVSKNFKERFPTAIKQTWKIKNEEFEVDFYLGAKKYEAKYEADGSWKRTSTKIDKALVPSAVMNSFRASKYAKWTIEDAFSVQTVENKELYLLEVISGNNQMELLYSAKGDLKKTKNKSN